MGKDPSHEEIMIARDINEKHGSVHIGIQKHDVLVHFRVVSLWTGVLHIAHSCYYSVVLVGYFNRIPPQ